MTIYSRVLDGAEVERRDFGDDTPPVLVATKGVWLPVVFAPRPDHDAGAEMVERLVVIGTDAVTDGWAVRAKTADELAADRAAALAGLRAERDARLAATDWLLQRHYEQTTAGVPPALSPEQMAAWLDYRHALRDLPETTEDPAAPAWPAAPGGE